MKQVFIEPEWLQEAGSKWFYLGVAEGSRNNTTSPTNIWTGGGAWAYMVCQNSVSQPSGGSEVIDSHEGPPKGTYSSPVEAGEWMHVEYLLVAESAPGADDGKAYIWVNGVLAGYSASAKWVANDDSAVGFDGMLWYGHHSGTQTQEASYRLGELLIAGKN